MLRLGLHALAALVVLVATFGAAHGQTDDPWAIDTPVVVPRTTLVLEPQRVYADPRLPAIETGLAGLSLPSIQAALEHTLDADPRYDVPERSTTAALLEASREDTRAELDFIARQSARIGIDSFRAWHIATAIDQLNRATEAFEQTAVPWLDPDVVADTWLHLALAHLERARSDDDQTARHRARARAAFRHFVRYAPARRLDPSEWPPSVVDAWTEAWVELLVDDGDALVVSADEAARIAEWTGAEQIVDIVALVDGSGLRLVVRIWDDTESRFVVDAVLPIEADTRQATAVLGEHLSRAIACQPLVLPTVVDDPRDDTRRFYATTGWGASVWMSGVTRRRFVNQGLHLSGNLLFTDNVSRVQTVRGTIGASLGARFDGWRVYGATGLEIGRIGRVQATTSFWCKVSEGEIERFDDERACEPGDVVDAPPTTTTGVELRVAGARRLAGAAWLELGVSTTLIVVPVDDRVFDFPINLDLGVSWRF